ncbi:hypothetical protein [Gordonibacter sp.]|uniref:hypothetical protein n=1 Tax=Gordonibacter sp. TaxID=1968902 RepID=UPI0025BFE712|nr:hypothetical protein [Gordonibacter sp.]
MRLLRTTSGFTLGEVLVTVLLVGLLTLAVAMGIGSAIGSYSTIKQATDANALLTNAVTAVEDELRFAYDVEAVSVAAGTGIDGNGTTAYTFDSSVRGYRLYLANTTDSDGVTSITLNGVNALDADGKQANLPADVDTLAALPLLNIDTAGTGASVQLTELTWTPSPNGRGGLWTFSVKVSGAGQDAESGTITVRAVNNW